MALLYADVRAYFSHVKMYRKRARLLSSHPRTLHSSFIHSFIHSFIQGNNHFPFYLSCPSATFALQHGGFVPREWLAAKGLLLESFRFEDQYEYQI